MDPCSSCSSPVELYYSKSLFCKAIELLQGMANWRPLFPCWLALVLYSIAMGMYLHTQFLYTVPVRVSIAMVTWQYGSPMLLILLGSLITLLSLVQMAHCLHSLHVAANPSSYLNFIIGRGISMTSVSCISTFVDVQSWASLMSWYLVVYLTLILQNN